MQQTTEPRDLTPKQAAEMLGVTERTLYDWRRRGEGPPWRPSLRGPFGRIRYALQDIRDHIERMTRRP
jgi:excisionase family DNA binding protein